MTLEASHEQWLPVLHKFLFVNKNQILAKLVVNAKFYTHTVYIQTNYRASLLFKLRVELAYNRVVLI